MTIHSLFNFAAEATSICYFHVHCSKCIKNLYSPLFKDIWFISFHLPALSCDILSLPMLPSLQFLFLAGMHSLCLKPQVFQVARILGYCLKYRLTCCCSYSVNLPSHPQQKKNRNAFIWSLWEIIKILNRTISRGHQTADELSCGLFFIRMFLYLFSLHVIW